MYVIIYEKTEFKNEAPAGEMITGILMATNTAVFADEEAAVLQLFDTAE